MRLLSLQIKNYRSIIDSGVIKLSDLDNVTVLAGQNESGKSSLLTSLRDFENNEFDKDSVPFSTNADPIQSVSCTYKIEKIDNFAKLLSDTLADDNNVKIQDGEVILDPKKIEKITGFTLTRTKQGENLTLEIDNNSFKILQASIVDKPSSTPIPATTEEVSTPPIVSKYLYIGDDKNSSIAESFSGITPKIVFFDDFCDLLPDKILVSDLKEKKTEVEGYKAVKNLEKILDVDFVAKDAEEDAVRKTKAENENENISIDFQKDWGQRIHGENDVLVEYDFQKRTGAGIDGSYINFYVQTKKGQRLPPKKRSKGLIWFLSLWLELKALDTTNSDLVLLLDEPDQHLHVKAQNDILKLINKLASKGKRGGDQIIYATHSPYLIETEHLNRIKLIINDEKKGTIVEDVITSKINTEYKRDALQPISNAIGLSVSDFSTLSKKNVLLEGVSDFYYFASMKKLLNKGEDYKFVPGIGVRQINNLTSLCIGYGLEWLAIIDDDPSQGGKDSKKKFDEIKDFVFDGDDGRTKEKVFILPGIAGIENMFTYEDLKLVDTKISKAADQTKAVGKKRKILFSKIFFEKVEKGEIKKEGLSKYALDNFGKAFDFIQVGFSLILG